MTWMNSLWAVDGNTLPGQFWRLQLQASALGAQGIINPGDLKVVPLATPGGSVLVNPGTCIVNGQEAAGQGAYSGINQGTDTVAVSPTAGSGRSDLIIARVEDPTVAGSAWSHNPATDQLIYSRDISGVPNTTITAPVGSSAIPLARIDIPASTSAITAAMIHDLRFLANPLVQRNIIVTAYGGATDAMNSGSTWRTWPSGQSWTLAIPSWAKRMRFIYTIGQVKCDPTASPGPTVQIRMNINGTFSQTTFLNANSGAPYRSTGILGDVIDVSAWAGTSIPVTPQGNYGSSGNGAYTIDSSVTLSFDYEFIEVPV